MDLHCNRASMSRRLQTQKLLLLSLHALYEPPEQNESQLNHLQPINWNEMLLGVQYSKLQPEDSTSYKVSFWRKSAFLCRPTNVIMNDILLTVESNAIHTVLSCSPHTNYSIVLTVTGGSLKKKKTTLKPHLVNKQKIKRQNHTRLPSKSLKGSEASCHLYGTQDLRYKKVCHLGSFTLFGS